MLKKSPTIFFGVIFITMSLLSGCQMGDSSQMSKSEQRRMQSTFNSLQESHRAALQQFKKDSASMSDDIKILYLQMQEMHKQMSMNHRHMMSGHDNKGMGMQQDNKQMRKRRQMRRQIQNRMSREWYGQMQSMHNQMARRHEQMSHPKRARQHRKMGEGYGKMKKMVPSNDESSKEPVNENADPAFLNGANLYTQYCASCHGTDAKGIGKVFPPLVNSKWITGEKSVPVRIVRDGVSGEIQVSGKIYNGTMPPFKARLSMAEIAAIINYLRDSSDGDHPHITQDDVIEISKTYQNRNNPWQPEELLGE